MFVVQISLLSVTFLSLTNVDMCFVFGHKWWLRAFFKEVNVSDMMVGHAHNGIDAVF
jgi:hypothetical protein